MIRRSRSVRALKSSGRSRANTPRRRPETLSNCVSSPSKSCWTGSSWAGGSFPLEPTWPWMTMSLRVSTSCVARGAASRISEQARGAAAALAGGASPPRRRARPRRGPRAAPGWPRCSAWKDPGAWYRGCQDSPPRSRWPRARRRGRGPAGSGSWHGSFKIGAGVENLSEVRLGQRADGASVKHAADERLVEGKPLLAPVLLRMCADEIAERFRQAVEGGLIVHGGLGVAGRAAQGDRDGVAQGGSEEHAAPLPSALGQIDGRHRQQILDDLRPDRSRGSGGVDREQALRIGGGRLGGHTGDGEPVVGGGGEILVLGHGVRHGAPHRLKL